MAPLTLKRDCDTGTPSPVLSESNDSKLDGIMAKLRRSVIARVAAATVYLAPAAIPAAAATAATLTTIAAPEMAEAEEYDHCHPIENFKGTLKDGKLTIDKSFVVPPNTPAPYVAKNEAEGVIGICFLVEDDHTGQIHWQFNLIGSLGKYGKGTHELASAGTACYDPEPCKKALPKKLPKTPDKKKVPVL